MSHQQPVQPGRSPERPPSPKSRTGETVLKVVGIGCLGTIMLITLAMMGMTQCMETFSANNRGPVPSSSNLDVRRPAPNPEWAKADEQMGQYLTTTEETWARLFEVSDRIYRPAKLVIFDAPSIATGCGQSGRELGPFYCSRDETIYMDTSFFSALAQRGAVGDFSSGFVLGHEIGHHIQKQTGALDQVYRQMEQVSQAEANQLSVGLELQADCYAGIWAGDIDEEYNLDPGDVEEAIATANAVGDDVVQMSILGRIDPSGFNHGSAIQRIGWFMRGFYKQDITTCDAALDSPDL